MIKNAFLWFSLFSTTASSSLVTETTLQLSPKIEIIQLQISDLKPTQSQIGLAEVNYKIKQYIISPKKKFDDYCKHNGGIGIQLFNQASQLNDIQSFQCKTPLGTDTTALKTVVKAPNQHYYLTDGHHLVSTLQKISGDQTILFVKVTSDQSKLQSMDEFWQYLRTQNQVWLKDQNYQNIDSNMLDTKISIEHLQDNPYRSIIYFLRNIAYGKSKQSVPFFEFYLAEWLNQKLPLNQLDLSTQKSYYNTLKQVANIMTSAPRNEVITEINGQKYTVEDFAIYSKVDHQALKKLMNPKGKLSVLFNSINHP